jgi:hypothetical protein
LRKKRTWRGVSKFQTHDDYVRTLLRLWSPTIFHCFDIIVGVRSRTKCADLGMFEPNLVSFNFSNAVVETKNDIFCGQIMTFV